MQWLIDLILEALGIPPVFIDRGDPAADDFLTGDLGLDGAWHNLDISGIVPSNASCIKLRFVVTNAAINRIFQLRKKGNVNNNCNANIGTHVAGVPYYTDRDVAIGTDGIVEYRALGGGWANASITVKGWWL